MKFDRSISGNIYEHQEIEQIARKAKELADLLPNPDSLYSGGDLENILGVSSDECKREDKLS